ncbi:DUF7504 family protein [Natrarchaeobaculum sulfurireducens]|uniref:KaiC-like protein ATPase n=2 Tax=Natrarchaeobaculum sulfurireducens TaxID=2044521 RepID=A0A346PV61_9EURY|nr:KaiC-like protein ATPase [Natrarchaeobaculum sulfurireducens]AXR83406.1 hypothetical protein AArcMg_3427 [Natrarchaeobaculum sulfurireducens]
MTTETTASTTVAILAGDRSLERWRELLAAGDELEVVQLSRPVDWKETAPSVDCLIATLETLESEAFDTVRRLHEVDETTPVVIIAPPEADQSVAAALDAGVQYCVITSSLEDTRPLLRGRIDQLVGRSGESPTDGPAIIDAVGDAKPPSVVARDSSDGATTPSSTGHDVSTRTPPESGNVERPGGDREAAKRSGTDSELRPGPAVETEESRSIRQRLASLSKAIGSKRHQRDETDDQSLTAESESVTDQSSSNADGTPHSETANGDTSTPATCNTKRPLGSSATDTQDVEPPSLPTYHDLEGGTSVLLESDTHSNQRGTCCRDLLGHCCEPATDILLIRYTPIRRSDLETLVASANRVGLIAVGYRQPFSEEIRDSVEYLEVSNPNDVTRVGILTTKLVDEWESSQPVDVGTAVCLDSLNILLQYKDRFGAFRFLHLLLSKLESIDAVTHVHVDLSAQNSQDILTLASLFDIEVAIEPTRP